MRFWLVLSLKTLALRRSTERRHRIYTKWNTKFLVAWNIKSINQNIPSAKDTFLHPDTVVWGRRIDFTAPDATLMSDYCAGHSLMTLSALLCASFVLLLVIKCFLPKGGFGWAHRGGARWKVERTSYSVSAHWLQGRLRTPKSSACRSSPFGFLRNLCKCISELCQLIQRRAHNQANHVHLIPRICEAIYLLLK